MTEAAYTSALAIYNPNGGHRTGKIYDVRDTTYYQNIIHDNTKYSAGTSPTAYWSMGQDTLVDSTESVPTHLVGKGFTVKKLTISATITALRYSTNLVDATKANCSIWVKSAVSGGATNFAISTNNQNVWNSGQEVKVPINQTWQRIDLDTLTTDSVGLHTHFGAKGKGSETYTDCYGDILICAPQITHGYGAKEESKTPKLDLTVTGGGGTRINAAGLVEDVTFEDAKIDYSTGSPAFLIEPASTNRLLNSATLATQSFTTSAVPYTLSFYGTGSITLSGAHSATLTGTGANQRVTLTFTPTAASLTLTVSGTVENAQLEEGSTATSYIPTNGAVVSRTECVAFIATPSGVTSIEEKVDGIVNTITTIPATYQMPQGAVEYVKFL